LSETERISIDTIEWYNNLRHELEQKGIPVNDINLFVNCMEGIKKLNFDIEKILNKYSDYEFFHSLIEKQKKISEDQAKEIDSLESRLSILKQEHELKRLKISKLNQLENLGFGLDEFRHLSDILREVSIENNMKARSAVKKFFKDLYDYDVIFGFDYKLKKQIEQTNNLNI